MSDFAFMRFMSNNLLTTEESQHKDETFNNNERYDVKTNKWFVETPMPTARHGLGAASVDNRIYVLGGGPQPGLSVSNANEIFHLVG